MRLLVDTNALLWALTDHPRLSQPAREAIGNTENDVFVSVVSAYELDFKAWLGKLPGFSAHALEQFVKGAGYAWLDVGLDAMRTASRLDWPERDPWDRIIVAQGIVRECTVISGDRAFRSAPVAMLW